MAAVGITIPKLVNGRGTLPIDRSFGHVGDVLVGQIRRASGTTQVKEYASIVRMLDQFANPDYSNGARLLCLLRDGELSFREVHEAWKKGSTSKVLLVPAGKLLREEIEKWLSRGQKRNGLPYRPATLRGYRVNFAQLLKHGGPMTSVRDLPKLLRKYRAWCVEDIDEATQKPRGYFTPYRQTLTACQAFVTATEEDGKYSQLYAELGKILPVAKVIKSSRKGRQLSEIRALAKRLPAREAQIVWNLAMTGMRFPSEYQSKWHIDDDKVVIPGTKNIDAPRYVPLIKNVDRWLAVRPATCAVSTFRRRLREATEGQMVPYEFRYSYQHLLERCSSKIDGSRRSFYFGHTSAQDSRNQVQANYRKHEYANYLKADAQALETEARRQLKKPKKV